MPKFKKTIVVGKIREEEVCKSIQKRYPNAYVVEGYSKGFDIVIPETEQTVEVKQDYKSYYTGNFVVEIGFGGKDSGLLTTTADWWVFVDYEKCYWITPEDLGDLVEELRIQPEKFVGTGDSVEKTAYLVKVNDLANSDSCFIRKREGELKSEEAYKKIWKEMGSPKEFTIDDMKWIDKNIVP